MASCSTDVTWELKEFWLQEVWLDPNVAYAFFASKQPCHMPGHNAICTLIWPKATPKRLGTPELSKRQASHSQPWRTQQNSTPNRRLGPETGANRAPRGGHPRGAQKKYQGLIGN